MDEDFRAISKQIDHMGERGRVREDSLRRFLGDYLPGRAGVSEGVIVDHTGRRSRQCDIVLYDSQSMPVFRLSDTVQLLPAETVFLVIEVKSSLGKPDLESTLVNIASAAQLERSAQPSRPMLAGYSLDLLGGDEITFTHKPSSIPGGIFTYDSPKLETLAVNVLEAARDRPRAEWPAFVVSLAQGTIIYGKARNDGTITSSVGA